MDSPEGEPGRLPSIGPPACPQLKLLREYGGCSQCGRKEVDAYELYEDNKLVCQPCLAQRTGSSTSPISFEGQSQ